LATARLAASRGARVVLAGRSGNALGVLADEIRARSGNAIAVTADASSEPDVRHIAQEAARAFGGFDTWVNNAAVSAYGRCLDVPLDSMRRIMETNFWGVVYGSRVACEHLRRRGGALINLGSIVSDRAAPLQGMYSASKHAIKGWTDALRMELAHDGAPVSVTLIKPAAINTPYAEHAENYLPDQPTHAPPVYTPGSAAEAILYAAANPVRELVVGSSGAVLRLMSFVAPALTEGLLARLLLPATYSGCPRHGRPTLYEPTGELREVGDYRGLVRTSLYTKLLTHPRSAGFLALAAGLMLAGFTRPEAQTSSSSGRRLRNTRRSAVRAAQ
jgi:short-subunit dehydrogenase